MLKSIFLVSNFFILLILFGCDKDDSTPSSPNFNQPPQIQSITASPTIVTPNLRTLLNVVATDPENDSLSYTWYCEVGFLDNSTSRQATWYIYQRSEPEGTYYIKVIVSDGRGIDKDSVGVNFTYGGK